MPDQKAEIFAEIRRILAAELEVAEPVELRHALAKDLGVDSMGAIVLAVGLEDRFRVKLADDDAATVVTVGDLVELVERVSRETNAARAGVADQGGSGR